MSFSIHGTRPKKILFICSAKNDYTRNEFIVKLLEENSELIKIYSVRDTYPERLVEIYWKYLTLKNKNSFDLIFAGFTAQPILPWIRLFYKKLILADIFISLYDTVCYDRKLFRSKSLLGKILFHLEKWGVLIADEWIVDTDQNKTFIADRYDVEEKKIKVLRVFANNKIFYPRNAKENTPKCDVFFYGSCQPLQGVPTILKAADLLNQKRIKFTLIGPIRKKYPELIAKYDLANVNFIDYVPYHELPHYIANAAICLGGPFGDTDKAKRVITGKTYQYISMKKPVILSDTIANKEIFNKKNVYLVPANDAAALAQCIKQALANSNDCSTKAEAAYNTLNKIKSDQINEFKNYLHNIG